MSKDKESGWLRHVPLWGLLLALAFALSVLLRDDSRLVRAVSDACLAGPFTPALNDR